MTRGVYYLPSADRLIYLSKVEHHENLYDRKKRELIATKCLLCTWEDASGVYERTLLTGDQYGRFIKVGNL